MSKTYDISFLRLYLEKLEITQTYLSEELNIGRTAIYKWLYGICLMSESYLPKLLEVLKSNSYNELKETVMYTYKYVPDIDKINNELLFRLASMLDISGDEYIIVQMLFGGFKGRCHSIDEISKILSVPRKYVLDIYYKYMNVISLVEKSNCDEHIHLYLMNNIK